MPGHKQHHLGVGGRSRPPSESAQTSERGGPSRLGSNGRGWDRVWGGGQYCSSPWGQAEHLCLSPTPQDMGTVLTVPQGFWEGKQRGMILGLISPQLGEGWELEDGWDIRVHSIHQVPEVASYP